MKRAKEPVAAATTLILSPILTPLGFQKRTQRRFVRLIDDIVQSVSLGKSSWGNPVYRVGYSCFALYPPADAWVLGPSFRNIDGHLIYRWRDSDTQDNADKTMTEVVKEFNHVLHPWFEKTKT